MLFLSYICSAEHRNYNYLQLRLYFVFWFEVYPNNHLIFFEQSGEEALQQYATNVEKLDEACLQVSVTGYIT